MEKEPQGYHVVWMCSGSVL